MHGGEDAGAVGHEDHGSVDVRDDPVEQAGPGTQAGSVRPSGGTMRASGSDAASRVCQWSSTWPRRPGTRTTVASLIGCTAGALTLARLAG